MDENMKLWEDHFKTDPSKTKKIEKGKRTLTAIDAYYRIKQATEEWGPMGSTWGFKDTEITIEHQDSYIFAIFSAIFFFPGGSFPSVNSIQLNPMWSKGEHFDDEFAKKIYTDALTKSLSYLGFGADVFMGLFDDNRYVDERRKEEAEKGKDYDKKALSAANKELMRYADENRAFIDPDFFKVDFYEKAEKEFDNNGIDPVICLNNFMERLKVTVEDRKAGSPKGEVIF
jgi:hypothetical protein